MTKNDFNLLGGVFTEVLTKKETLKYFIADTKLYPEDKTLTKFSESFTKLYKSISPKIEKLANIEIIIQQIKAIKAIPLALKYSIVGNTYIYARTPFFDPKSYSIDVRVIVGKLSDYEDYQNNPVLHSIAVEKLTEKANEILEQTLLAYNEMYETKKKKQKTVA